MALARHWSVIRASAFLNAIVSGVPSERLSANLFRVFRGYMRDEEEGSEELYGRSVGTTTLLFFAKDTPCLQRSAPSYAGFCSPLARSDDHLSRIAVARDLGQRRRGGDGTITGSPDPNPPCTTMSLPIPLARDPRSIRGVSLPIAWTPCGGGCAGYRLCGTCPAAPLPDI